MIEIKPIKTKYNYKNALNTIDKLLDAKSDIEERDYLDLEKTFVEKYEDNILIFQPLIQ